MSEVIRALHRPNEEVDFGRSASDWLTLLTIKHPALPDLDVVPIETVEAWSKPPVGDNERLHERWQDIARREIDLLLQRGSILEMTSVNNEIKVNS